MALADGRQVWVHVPNSGALTGCAPPGGDILLTEDRRPGRKTDYTWRFTRVDGGWTCIDTLVPNRVVAEALAGGGLPGLPRPLGVRAEVTVPQGSRLDFVHGSEAGLLFLEVKSITWVEDGVALFPDGVTTRGRRHLEHLAALVRQGHQAWNVFVVQRQDASLMRPAAGWTRLTPGNWPRPRPRASASWCSRKKSSPRKLPLPPPCPLI